jgi:hypothetical protein
MRFIFKNFGTPVNWKMERRRIFRLYKSWVLTLPPYWANKQQTREVVVLADDLLIVAPATKEQLLHEIICRGLQAVANNEKQEES